MHLCAMLIDYMKQYNILAALDSIFAALTFNCLSFMSDYLMIKFVILFY